MTTRLLLILFLLQKTCTGQFDSTGTEKRYYSNGRLKFSAVKHGTDTIELKKYYKSGQIKDSVWLYLPPKSGEIPFGTARSWYPDGKISAIKHYFRGHDSYLNLEFWENGILKRFEQRPTGLTKTYNKKGVQTGEIDLHQLTDVHVPRAYKKQRHLKKSEYPATIFSNTAFLATGKSNIKLKKGLLISLTLRSDTNLISHCQIEGFSRDTIFLSRFHYNENHSRGSGLDVLKYDSTFVLCTHNIRSIAYSPHNTVRRKLGGVICQSLGVEILLTEIILIPFLPAIVHPLSGENLANTAYMYGGLTALALPLFYYGRHMVKTAIPVLYDLDTFKIVVRTKHL